MAYTSLYRKYRPQSFSTMIGQQHIRQTLKNAILSHNIAHAYLFTGTRGTGKTSTAKIFAKAINCLNPKEDGSPCGVCENCLKLSNPNNLDIIELDAASNNSVEDIRELIDKVKFMPTVGKYKVYIVDEVHMLSKQAFNAFLKTLEEPPEHVVFILATTEVYKIPATILSRCIRFDFRLLSKEDLTNHLATILNDMNIEYEKEALMTIADAGNGSVRDSLSIADMVLSYCGNKKVTYKDVLDVLGSSSPDTIINIVDNILTNRISQSLSLASKTLDMGKSVEVLASDLAEMFKNVLYVKNCSDAKELLALPLDIYSRLKDISKGCSNTKLYKAIEIFANVQNQLKYTTSARVILEMSIAKACDLTYDLSMDGLLNRIKDLEAFKRRSQSTDGKGTTLTEKQAWGAVLNTLNNENDIPAYNCAAKVKANELRIENRVFIIEVENNLIYQDLLIFKDQFERLIISEFHDIDSLKIILKKDEKKEAINKTKDLFSNIKIEE